MIHKQQTNLAHREVFFYATAFNEDISAWDVAKVTNMDSSESLLLYFFFFFFIYFFFSHNNNNY